MADRAATDIGLDGLASRARGGDRTAEGALLADLQVRFLAIAKRRVGEDDAEDLVQDALRVVHERHAGRPQPAGVLPWALAVLRNVIGNHYQARRRRERVEGVHLDGWTEPPAGPSATPGVVGLDGDDDLVTRVTEAIGRLAGEHERCGRLLRILLRALEEEDGPRAVSRRTMERARREIPGLTSTNFHVTLHRCRGRLRRVLEELEADEAR